jgi:hypothetical protein
MKCATFSLGIICAIAVLGCNPFNFNRISGSGQITTRNYDLKDFQSVDAGACFEVKIQPGKSFAVSVTTDSNLLEDLTVRQDGDWLYLGVKPGINVNPTKLVANITMPSLASISASGATDMEFGSFTMNDFKAEASGASKIHGEVHAQHGLIDCSGASNIKFVGEISDMNVKASGASSANCGDLTANKGYVELSGASNAKINATHQLDYDLSGASHLDYFGQPSVGRSGSSGASSANHKATTL